MSVQNEIQRLSAAKASIAASLRAMGAEPPQGTTLDQYAAQLDSLAENINTMLDAINGEVV